MENRRYDDHLLLLESHHFMFWQKQPIAIKIFRLFLKLSKWWFHVVKKYLNLHDFVVGTSGYAQPPPKNVGSKMVKWRFQQAETTDFDIKAFVESLQKYYIWEKFKWIGRKQGRDVVNNKKLLLGTYWSAVTHNLRKFCTLEKTKSLEFGSGNICENLLIFRTTSVDKYLKVVCFRKLKSIAYWLID